MIPEYKKKAGNLELVGDGMNSPITIEDSDEHLVAKYGQKIDYKTAITYFPKLKDPKYLAEIGLNSYDGEVIT